MIAPVTDFYFAYGSNMGRSRLEERIGSVEPVGAACLEGFRLVFNKPSKDGSGKANLVSAQGSVAWGVVWQIGYDRWSALDPFEPGYQRIVLQARTRADAAVRVGVYLHPATGRDIPPFDWYIDHLIVGAREHALPQDWLDALILVRGRAHPTRPSET